MFLIPRGMTEERFIWKVSCVSVEKSHEVEIPKIVISREILIDDKIRFLRTNNFFVAHIFIENNGGVRDSG